MANVKDGATSTVATAPSPATSGTSLVVQSGEGARFPSPPFYAIVHPASSLPVTSNAEKVLVTAVSTNTFTIVRAQGIYTAKSIATGWRISNAIFQEDINNSSIIQNEVPGGSVNGSNTAFTLASATGMVTGSLKLFKNGIRLKIIDDYTETSTGFSMVTAPATGTKLLADYNVNGALNNIGTNSIIVGEVPSGSINGSNAVFTLARSYIAGSVDVKVNGISQARTTHFTETSPSLGTVTLSDAPLTGDVVTVNYMYNLNPSGNADTVDGIHANSTPTANQLVPLDSNAKLPASVLKSYSVTGSINVTSATWYFVPFLTGASRVRVSVDAKYTTASAGTAILLAFNATNSGTPSNQASAQDYYVSNTATVGRDNSGTVNYVARTYSNAANFTSHMVAEIAPFSSYSHGASIAGTAMEAMTTMSINSTGTSWMSSPYLAIYGSGTAGTINYTIEYFY